MKYTQLDFEQICSPISTDLKVDLNIGPGDAYDLRSLSRLCANRITIHQDWGILGGRLLLKIIRSTAGKTFSESTKFLKIYLNREYYNFVMENAKKLDEIVDESKSNNKQSISIGVLEKTYLLKYNKCGNCKKDCPDCEKFYVGETPDQMYMRIATFTCMPDFDMIRQAYEYMSDQKYSHATPTMYNAGCERHQMASCFVLSIQDSLWSIEDHWTYIGEISRNSGGIGLDVSNIRHSYIGNSGKSDGVPALLKPIEKILDYVDQSKKRKGSAAIFLSIWHIDIEDFINLKVPVGQNGNDANKCLDLFYSVWCHDLFMQRCEEDANWTLFCPKRSPGLTEVWGDKFVELYTQYEKEGRGLKIVKARKLLKMIFDAQTKVGVPYICMVDRFNESNMQENIGIVRSSNLCVSGDTRILTHLGYQRIDELEGNNVYVWNGQQFSQTTVFKTGENQKMLKIKFSNGQDLTCTYYHKFYLNGKAEPIEAKDLVKGMQLISSDYPLILKGASQWHGQVPYDCDWSVKEKWIHGLIKSHGKISRRGFLHVTSGCEEFIKDCQLLFHTMSCNPVIVKNRKSNSWRMIVNPFDLFVIGVLKNSKNLTLTSDTRVFVTDIQVVQELHDTYCFKEERRGMGVFNGILTGQCSEIGLHTSDKEIASCNLASLCLSNFVRDGQFDFTEFSNVVRFVVRIMNNIIDRNFYLDRVPQIKYANLKNRPLGIGIQGLASTYALLEMIFDSEEAKELNNRIIQTMYYTAVDESANLARIDGAYPAFPGSPYSRGKLHPDLWKAPNGDTAKFLPEFDWAGLREKVKGGVRNSTLLALMPTASSSIIAEQTPCFEPINFIVGSKTLISGQYTFVCPEFAQDMEKLGVWSPELCEQIWADEGNVLGGIAHLKMPASLEGHPLKIARWRFLMDKYRTAHEIGPQESILQAIDRTPFVCQSQSINWFVSDPTWKHFYKNVIQSWRRGAKTVIYYARGKAGAKARAVAQCTSCTV